MTREFEAAAETFGLGLEDFEKITINAMKSAFLPYRERCNFIYSTIKPGYAKIRESLKPRNQAQRGTWPEVDQLFPARKIRCGDSEPQRLKPEFSLAVFGTTEVVPSPKSSG